MDNDILIDQARQLYAALLIKQSTLPLENSDETIRLDHLVICAYCRYQRRLNRCILCYRWRLYDCIRVAGKKRIPCSRRPAAIWTDTVLINAWNSK